MHSKNKMKSDYKELIAILKAQKDNSYFKKIKIALLSSYTIKNIEYPLTYELLKKGFDCEIKFGGYNQYLQELLDNSSWLYSFNPDIILIANSTNTFFNDLEYNVTNMSQEELNSLINSKMSHLVNAIIQCSLSSKIVLTNLDIPVYSPYSLMDPIAPNSLGKSIADFNRRLSEMSIETRKFNILDFDKVCSIVGKSNMTDHKMYYLGKIVLNEKAAEALSSEFARIVNALYGKVKKCLVVDLDNTLWGGVIGEDGVHGINIGDTNLGAIYADVQRILLNYKKSGVLLAIASKNNFDEAIQAFRENKNMILKEEDFVAKKINWNFKSQNIREIAQELNIGIDSFVFLDDNPSERLEVKTNLPEVEIIDFPQDISNLPALLKEISHFHMLNITEEDMKRSEMYIQDKKRDELKKHIPLADYLNDLGIEITIEKNNINSLERITQIINKTNQFNLRTQRYTSEQVRAFIESEDSEVISLRVKDKFGDLGLTGVIIIKKEDKYFIDTFLMSCRILSRKIENQFFLEAMKIIRGAKEIQAEYIPTPKNSLVKEIYETLGFKLVSEEKGIKSYSAFLEDIKNEEIPWIKVNYE